MECGLKFRLALARLVEAIEEQHGIHVDHVLRHAHGAAELVGELDGVGVEIAEATSDARIPFFFTI